jgi:hypothetical protein
MLQHSPANRDHSNSEKYVEFYGIKHRRVMIPTPIISRVLTLIEMHDIARQG